MFLAFTLSMPRRGSFNHKWLGDSHNYVQVRHVPDEANGRKILAGQPFDYDLGDGWVARVSVRRVGRRKAERIRRVSVGFDGYDWMIDSILLHSNIRKPSEYLIRVHGRARAYVSDALIREEGARPAMRAHNVRMLGYPHKH